MQRHSPLQDHGKVLSIQSERQLPPHPDLWFNFPRNLGSRNWHTRASETKLACYSKEAQRNPLLKPFLTPASAPGNELARKALLPLGIIIGVVRVLVVVVVGSLYFLLASVLSVLSVSSPSNGPQGTILMPLCQVIPPIRIAKRLFAAVFARLTLFVLGFWWIPVEVVNKKRGYVEERSTYIPFPNSATTDGIRQTKAGAHVPGISSYQTGYRGSNCYGSRSGTTLPSHPSHVRPNGWSSCTGSTRHSFSQSRIPSNSTQTPPQPPPSKHPAVGPVQAQPQSQTPPHSPPKTDNQLPMQRSSVTKSFRFGL